MLLYPHCPCLFLISNPLTFPALPTNLSIEPEIEAGKIDADYGGGVIKQRIARPNEGKSVGFRSIILYRKDDKAFFVYGFSKKVKENLSGLEVREFKAMAKIIFSLPYSELSKLAKKQSLSRGKSKW